MQIDKRVSLTEVKKLELPEIFRNGGGPFEIDLGCHKGTFLVGLASSLPTRRFLGIERQRKRVENCLRKIARLELPNAFAVQAEGLAAVRETLPVHSVDVIHVMFPDPWPKRRHYSRRLVNRLFLADARLLLRKDGELRLMTDDDAYFAAMGEAIDADGGFHEVPWENGQSFPETEFQKKFLAIGKPFYRLAVRPSMASK